MNEELLYVLEENNKNDISRIMEQESFCETFEEKGLELHIIRMQETGSFGVFLSKKEGSFNEKELLVVERYLSNVGRTIDIEGEERIGVVLDKESDIRPFNAMDINFGYNKTYKTQAYARMIGISIMNEVKEFNKAKPDRELVYNNIY